MSYDHNITGNDMHPQPSHNDEPARPQDAETRQPAHDDYDDGLVHGHFWAKTSTTH
jgi:hypothetical protein